MNKLHVIYGLADLEEYEELNDYLGKILEPEQEFSHRMIFLVKNPVIAGFLIGERSKFTEQNYPFMIEGLPGCAADHRPYGCTMLDQHHPFSWTSSFGEQIGG